MYSIYPEKNLNRCERFEKFENLSSYAHVVHITAKRDISRVRNVHAPMEKTGAKLNHDFSLFNMKICKVLGAIAVVVDNNLAIISKPTCFSS